MPIIRACSDVSRFLTVAIEAQSLAADQINPADNLHL